jgi:GTPase SAR1 family protein
MNTRSPPRELRAVAPTQIEPSRPKIVLFGKPGVGKTFGALDFPQPYYIDTEGGAKQDQYRKKLIASNGGYLGPDQGSREFSTVVD